MSLDDYFYLSKKHGYKHVTPVILIGIDAQIKYGLTYEEALHYTNNYLHQENCGDTPSCQQRPGTYPEDVKVSRENEGNTGDSK